MDVTVFQGLLDGMAEGQGVLNVLRGFESFGALGGSKGHESPRHFGVLLNDFEMPLMGFEGL